MMTPREIEMCVLDCLQDDDVEDIAALLRMLNGEDDDRSWESARGLPFGEAEVQSALARLMESGLVTPAAEHAAHHDGVRRIPREAVGASIPWAEVWFHIEPEGRKVVHSWWNAEGQAKYPLGRK
jgi:hypothetical protein